jgi:hypothetical protein
MEEVLEGLGKRGVHEMAYTEGCLQPGSRREGMRCIGMPHEERAF